MIDCPRCDQVSPDGVNFCTRCGLPLFTSAETAIRHRITRNSALAVTVKGFYCGGLGSAIISGLVGIVGVGWALVADSSEESYPWFFSVFLVVFLGSLIAMFGFISGAIIGAAAAAFVGRDKGVISGAIYGSIAGGTVSAVLTFTFLFVDAIIAISAFTLGACIGAGVGVVIARDNKKISQIRQ